jgi:mannose-6-phosphate isomerase-like protein (cupin superfamily)
MSGHAASSRSRPSRRPPWGSYTVLDEGDGWKVKRIEVLPGKRLSYQKHAQRAEHWMIVAGSARLTLDGLERLLATARPSTSRSAPRTASRIPGRELLVFVEIQRGPYLGEDDIVRLADDFGRTSA